MWVLSWMFGLLVLACWCGLSDADELSSREVYVTTGPTSSFCENFPIPHHPDYYVEMPAAGGWTMFQCPDGMTYDQDRCACKAKPLGVKTFLKAMGHLFDAYVSARISEPSTTPYPLTAPFPTTTPTTTTTPATTTTTRSTTTTTTTTPAPTTTTTTTTRAPTTTTTTTTHAPTTTTTTTTHAPTTTTTTTTHAPTTTQTPKWNPVTSEKPLVLTQPVTTTTPSPVTTLTDLCRGCEFDQGVGYNVHPSDCAKYTVCLLREVNAETQVTIRDCHLGQYWDQASLTCRNSFEVKCKNDVCSRYKHIESYAQPDNCRAYWRCENGVSVLQCCPEGEAYKEGQGCVLDIDSSCSYPCIAGEGEAAPCDKIGIPGSPSKFKQEVKGHGFVEMECAAGTVYNVTSCDCQMNYGIQLETSGCKDELVLNLSNGIKDVSGNGVHVQGVNVSLESGVVCFHGDGALVIPRFANVDIGGDLTIKLRYRLSDPDKIPSDDIQALLYNGDCGQRPTLVAAASTSSAFLGLRNSLGRYKGVAAPTRPEGGGWINAEYSFHKNTISLNANGQSGSRPLLGTVMRSRCALKVGWGEGYKSFTGCISHAVCERKYREISEVIRNNPVLETL